MINKNRVLWLSINGNKITAYLLENEHIRILFYAFKSAPNILRLYGKEKEIKVGDASWSGLISLLLEKPVTRQIFDISNDFDQTSCGMSIPFFEHKSERNELNVWAKEIVKTGIKKYWADKNQQSIDGLST
jgi:hypothetical protein